MAMHASLARLAVLLVLLAAPARADELADFNTAVEGAAAHQRVALGYLRTGNNDLAALEIERMREAWGAVTDRFGRPPAALGRDRKLYNHTMLDVTTRLVAASIMIDTGHTDAARDALTAIRAELTALRKANGIAVLSDCIGDSNAAMDRLMAFDKATLDWSKTRTGTDISAKASAYQRDLERCDAMASPQIRATPEFRRLIDGARASLALFPKAIAERDPDLLHRLLGELRAIDSLLAFRFG
jgi:hypothetical protein